VVFGKNWLAARGAFIWLAASIFGASATLAQEEGPTAAASELSDPIAASAEKPQLIDTELFAGRSPISGAKLSPDGDVIAFKTTRDGKPILIGLNVDTSEIVASFLLPDEMEFGWFRWAGNDKVIFSLSQRGEFFDEEVRYTRLFAVHMAEGWIEFIGSRDSVVDGDDVIFVAEDGSHLLLSVQRDIRSYPSVMRFELEPDTRGKQVQGPKQYIWEWFADDAGVVRAGTGWRLGKLKVYYRKSDGEKLRLVGRLKEEDEAQYWDIAQIVSGSDQGYVLQKGDSERVGLYLFDYSTRQVVEQIYEHPEWDLDGASIRDGKPYAAYFTDDQERVVWFDEDQKKLNARLRRSLPEDRVWVSSRAEDNSRMLVRAGGEADPGAVYIYTPAANRLDLLSELRPGLKVHWLAKPRAIEYKARDGTGINGYLTLPKGRKAAGLPLIIMPHGGPYGVRDSLVYDDWVQMLANRGYAVLQPNYRGSGGYGEAFFELGRGQVGRAMQDDLDDAMDWAVAEGYADADRVCVVGGSYGGYAALWAVIRNPERYRCAASWAGVTDWEKMLSYDRNFMTRKGGRKWKRLVEGNEKFDLDAVSPYRLADQLTRPVLLAHGTKDSNVPFSQFKRFRKAAEDASVRPVELIIEDEGHSFSSAENEQQWFDALDTFLKQHNPAD